MSSAAAAAAATATDCATPPSKKGKIGDNLFDVDSDPDLALGRLSSPTSPFSLPGHMTSPGLSVEGSALLQAINSSLGPRIDTANSQLASMNHRMINIESAVSTLDGRVSATERSLEEVKHRTEALERRSLCLQRLFDFYCRRRYGKCSTGFETHGLDTSSKTNDHCCWRFPEGHAKRAHYSTTS